MADAEANTTTTTTTTTEGRCSCCDFRWIISTKEGWLKLIEAIFTFLTFVIMSSFPYTSDFEPAEYLIFVSTTAFVFVIIHIFLRMVHLFEKLPDVLRHPVLGMVGCFLASLALLIGSSIVFAKGKKYNNLGELEAAGVCGYICTVLFFCEGLYYVFLYRRLPRAQKKPEGEEVQADEFVQPSKPAY